jgi:alanyl-tRNA synthetase
MTADEIRQKYLKFFTSSPRNHQQIPLAPLVPKDDPTTLFTGSGMQQLVPFLKGEPHPMGKRLVDSQPCFRAEDIDEVGDNRHTTFFEMLGNWSLGDYFKEEQLEWCWKFLTKEVGLSKDRLWVTVFDGVKGFKVRNKKGKLEDLKPDVESKDRWIRLGVPKERIVFYGADKNWWSRAGEPEKMPPREIGGPDSEVFFEFTDIKHDPKFGKTCHPNCDCGRFLEIGNSVFMQYMKIDERTFKELPNKNVDFGGGLERIVAVVQNTTDVFQTDLFLPIIEVLTSHTSSKYQEHAPAFRRIADHIKGAVMMGAESIIPSNKEQGYFMRRLIRRSLMSMRQIKIDYTDSNLIHQLTAAVANIYRHSYPQAKKNQHQISQVISQEANRFAQTLNHGISKLKNLKTIDGKVAFDLYQSYGLPLEITQELVSQMGKQVDEKKFAQEFKKHQDISRAGAEQKFKGGLADQSDTTIKLHTATHLLHQALRQILGDHVRQEGSNITADRLRFDFSHPQPLTDEEIKKIEDLINQKIKEDLPVTKTIEDKDQALKSGALAFFKETYPDKVSVYTIGQDPAKDWFSKEVCGGPHVSSTGQIGGVRIKKEESIGAGKRRIYVVLSDK